MRGRGEGGRIRAGAAKVAPALAAEGCRHFFVAHLDEAIALRSHLPEDVDLFVLHGLPPGTEADCIEHRVIPVLNSLAQIDAWTELARARGRKLPAILQVDTGMSRLGLSPAEMAAIVDAPDRLDGIALRYVMSHLACAEQQDSSLNAEQLDRFRAVTAALPGIPASLANSSGVFLERGYHFDLARPGAALYGVAPVAGQANPMQPVVRLQGRVIQIARSRQEPQSATAQPGAQPHRSASPRCRSVTPTDSRAASATAPPASSARPLFRLSASYRWTPSPSTCRTCPSTR